MEYFGSGLPPLVSSVKNKLGKIYSGFSRIDLVSKIINLFNDYLGAFLYKIAAIMANTTLGSHKAMAADIVPAYTNI